MRSKLRQQFYFFRKKAGWGVWGLKTKLRRIHQRRRNGQNAKHTAGFNSRFEAQCSSSSSIRPRTEPGTFTANWSAGVGGERERWIWTFSRDRFIALRPQLSHKVLRTEKKGWKAIRSLCERQNNRLEKWAQFISAVCIWFGNNLLAQFTFSLGFGRLQPWKTSCKHTPDAPDHLGYGQSERM